MTDKKLVLAIDQGTTSTRSILFDAEGRPHAAARRELTQIYPRPGWVEHDPEAIWQGVCDTAREAIATAEIDAREVAAIGITNQRETTLIWDRASGRPIHNAIVWQDRRTSETCRRLKADGAEALVTAKTGLVLDPYFSATKIAWLLDHEESARERAAGGDLCFGTIDSYLIWRLTGGTRHSTSATNAARTSLYNIHTHKWDAELLDLFGVPAAMLPEIQDDAGDYGIAEPAHFGAAIPITGVAGDQQAAVVGQCCFEPGMIKSTYGTGCFALLNTGSQPIASQHGLLATIAYRIDGKAAYALEGSIFTAGAVVQWLRDGLGIIESAAESELLARTADPKHSVVIVPAFTGLGAPYWAPDARGAILGLTRDTGRAEIAHAALDSVAFQTRALLEAMRADGAQLPTALRVDGGMTENGWFVQRLADLVGVPVEVAEIAEATAAGAAQLARLGAGLQGSLDESGPRWRRRLRAEPALAEDARDDAYATWQEAVGRVVQ